MTPEHGSRLVDDVARRRLEPVPREEAPIVAAGEEARLLALGPARRGKAGSFRLASHLGLRVTAEREHDAVEAGGIDRREHVGLVLRGVGASRDEMQSVAPDDTRVVARPEGLGADPLRERGQSIESERPVASHARVRRQAGRIAVHERAHDGVPEVLPQVQRDVRKTEGVTGLARSDHGVGGAAGALGGRPCRVEPETERHPDRASARPGGARRRCRPRRSWRLRRAPVAVRRLRREPAHWQRRPPQGSLPGRRPPRAGSTPRAAATSRARRPRGSARPPRRGARARRRRRAPSRRSAPAASAQASVRRRSLHVARALRLLAPQPPPGALPCP